jgi:hypothetical protein
MRLAPVVLAALTATACSSRAPVLRTTAGDDTRVPKGTTYRWTFDEPVPSPGTGEIPVPRARTFVGVLGHWAIVGDADAPSAPGVYRQDSRYSGSDTPRVLVSDLVFRDLAAHVRCRPDAGVAAEGCGLVFDARGSDDYLVARADAIDHTVRLVRVQAGEEREIASAPALVTPHVWHELALRTRGERIAVDWDGVRVVEAVEWTRGGGKIGLATSADAVSSFDDLEVVAE